MNDSEDTEEIKIAKLFNEMWPEVNQEGKLDALAAQRKAHSAAAWHEEHKNDPPTQEILLPKAGKLVSEFATEVGEALKERHVVFYRQDSREVVEIGMIEEKDKNDKFIGFIPIKPSRFITICEKYFTPVVRAKETQEDGSVVWVKKEKSMTSELANITLCSPMLQETIKGINKIFTVPIPILNGGGLAFPSVGYDSRFKSWLPPDAPKISNSEMILQESKEIIDNMYKEFCFETEQDKTNAIAALITPFLRGLYCRSTCRTPIFVYIGNRERCGKDYCAGLTGIIYEGKAREEPPISSQHQCNSDEELNKIFTSVFMAGRKRLHFSNNKGYLNSAALESIITSENYSGRILGGNNMADFPNEMEFSLSGNMDVKLTPDLANRGRPIKLFLDIEDANQRKFDTPNLHQWAMDNRDLVLSALYGLIRNWFDLGCPSGSKPFASYSEWARVCGGIMEAAGYDSPCEQTTDTLSGMDSETENMKMLFELCYAANPEKAMSKHEIKELSQTTEEPLFGFLDFSLKKDQTRFGFIIKRFAGRILSDIKMVSTGGKGRTARKEYYFTKKFGVGAVKNSEQTNLTQKPKDGNLGNVVTPEKEKTGESSGNLGNLGNVVTPENKNNTTQEKQSRERCQPYQPYQKGKELTFDEIFHWIKTVDTFVSDGADKEAVVADYLKNGRIMSSSPNRYVVI